MNDALHVVLGSGQIGSLVAEALLARGTRVRLVRRGAAGAPRPGLEWRSGDLSELSFAEEATRGAAVVYDCTSPPYDAWLTLLLPLARGAMHGARSAGAKLVALDNLYMYGRVSGPIHEGLPIHPCSKKGEVRAKLAEERQGLCDRGELPIATGRASDFFGPGIVRQTTFGVRFFERVFAGKAAECFGDPDAPHTLAYAPDVARALVTLADHDEAFGHVWHLPANPAESMRQTTARLAKAIGRPIRVTRVPRIALRAMGVFEPMAREVAEMAYQWEAPYLVDDSRFRSAFGAKASGASGANVAGWTGVTEVDAIMRATGAWAKRTFGAEARPAAVSG
ncbi:MAG TPA: NAD-dependent epimerase/dehydratase family protein [Polyangiaceae bacterium]|jgi:nucleoside-diphosphate-sugar epimerase